MPLPVEIAGRTVRPPSRAEIAAAFDTVYRATYGRLLEGGARRLLNPRTAVIGRRPRFDLAAPAPGPEASRAAADRDRRPVHLGGAWRDTPVLDRLALPVGTQVAGPAVLEQPDATILVEPGFAPRVDRLGNVIIDRAGAAP